MKLGPTMARDQAILDALDKPMSAREISEKLRQQALDAWAEEHGYGEVEWGTDQTGPNEPFGARMLALTEARERGTYPGLSFEVYPRLLYLERHGRVERIQIEGHRPMLWTRRASTPDTSAQGEERA